MFWEGPKAGESILLLFRLDARGRALPPPIQRISPFGFFFSIRGVTGIPLPCIPEAPDAAWPKLNVDTFVPLPPAPREGVAGGLADWYLNLNGSEVSSSLRRRLIPACSIGLRGAPFFSARKAWTCSRLLRDGDGDTEPSDGALRGLEGGGAPLRIGRGRDAEARRGVLNCGMGIARGGGGGKRGLREKFKSTSAFSAF